MFELTVNYIYLMSHISTINKLIMSKKKYKQIELCAFLYLVNGVILKVLSININFIFVMTLLFSWTSFPKICFQ